MKATEAFCMLSFTHSHHVSLGNQLADQWQGCLIDAWKTKALAYALGALLLRCGNKLLRHPFTTLTALAHCAAAWLICVQKREPAIERTSAARERRAT